jgi:uncharacterized C2H2 Zn-finger protein
MKKTFAFSLLVASVLLLGLAVFASGPAKKAAAQEEMLYVCPKCDAAFDKPGKCACGADLVPVKKSEVYYACDMCEVKSDKPGKCPKCGMDMKLHVKSWEKAKEAQGQKKTT